MQGANSLKTWFCFLVSNRRVLICLFIASMKQRVGLHYHANALLESTSAALQGRFYQRQQQQHEHRSCRVPARAPTSFSNAGPSGGRSLCVARFNCVRVRTRAGAHRSVPEIRGTAAPPPLPEEPPCPLPSPPRCSGGDMTALARASGSACLHCPPVTNCQSFASMGWSSTRQVPCPGGPHSSQGGGTQELPPLRNGDAVNPCKELPSGR